eukprot:gb/GECH01012852.1/.p1 GENE.gb/GECH01012852.1/~~gb/GECH01012852.1/.p1  ORF type:complete len:320 (+),score=68.20 gb/GECH01012852.1/:1-960(+)
MNHTAKKLIHSPKESTDQKKNSIFTDAAGQLFCGGVAGSVSRTVASPFERLKILFQVQDMNPHAAGQYKGIFRSIVDIGKEEGWRGYFKGNGTNVVRVIPYSSVQFVSYEQYKRMTKSLTGQDELNYMQRMMCGGLAGISSVAASYPLDLIRCRLSAQGNETKYRGIWHCGKTIFVEEGFLGLYKGILPTLCGIAPYVGFNFSIYELLKSTAPKNEQGEPSVFIRLMLGGVAGSIAQTITYPLDVIRRRMQMDGFSGREPQYRNTADAFRKVYAQYGVKGFYRGLIPNYLKVIPVVSVSFVVYEKTKQTIGLGRSGKEI